MAADRTERGSDGRPSDHEATDWREASHYGYTRTLTRAEWMEEFVRRSCRGVPAWQNCVLPAKKPRLARVSRCPIEECLRQLVVELAQRLCRHVARGNP